MLDCVGSMGVKRLKPEHRRHIPGVIGYCRRIFEQQVPFDYRVPPGRCRALLPRADREGVPIPGAGTLRASPDRRLGASDQLSSDRALDALYGSGLVLEQPDHTRAARLLARQRAPRGVGLALLETVFGPEPKRDRGAAPGQPAGINLRGDLELTVFPAGELRRSYSELPVRWMCDLALHPRVRGLLAARGPDTRRAGRTNSECMGRIRSRPGKSHVSASRSPDWGGVSLSRVEHLPRATVQITGSDTEGTTTMIDPANLDHAIAAHAKWKFRLREAIKTGRNEWSADKVAPKTNANSVVG